MSQPTPPSPDSNFKLPPRLAVDTKFPVHIRIHIHRFSVDIHGYIHIHRRLSRVYVASRFFSAKYSSTKASILCSPEKNNTKRLFATRAVKNTKKIDRDRKKKIIIIIIIDELTERWIGSFDLIDRSGWAARGKYLSSDVINCTASLTYSAELVRPGIVDFTYQHEDDGILFTFQVFSLCQNYRCKRHT